METMPTVSIISTTEYSASLQTVIRRHKASGKHGPCIKLSTGSTSQPEILPSSHVSVILSIYRNAQARRAMTISWINISTRWELASVQASLNLFVSVLGTIGTWAFSKYWWQRARKEVLSNRLGVPLLSLFNISSLGDSLDAITVYRRQALTKENWRLLVQIVVVLTAAAASMFAGPIAKVSLRNVPTLQPEKIEITPACKGDGHLGVRINGEVDWNQTMRSLDRARFPYNQLLDYLPVVTAPWEYVASEWSPTWTAGCTFYEEVVLDNLTASGVDTFMHPLDAFPAYKETFNTSWINNTGFRMESNFNLETVHTGGQDLLIKDALVWTIIQTDPEADDRMFTNKEPLQISISALHAKNLGLSYLEDFTQASLDDWRPQGTAENASFSRMECEITREPQVLDDAMIPWPWMNDTYSIAVAYKTYWMTIVGKRSARNLSVIAPTPHEIFRFYQAYVFSVNSWLSRSTVQSVSVWKDTVQLSTYLLIVITTLWVSIMIVAVRYFWFQRRHKKELEDMGTPDTRLDWIVHAARVAAQDEEQARDQNIEDRDFLNVSSFGQTAEPSTRPYPPARVYLSRNLPSAGSSPPLEKNRFHLSKLVPSHRRHFKEALRRSRVAPTAETLNSRNGIDNPRQLSEAIEPDKHTEKLETSHSVQEHREQA